MTPTSADQRIRELARAHPDQDAVIELRAERAAAEVLTWAELDERSAVVSERLRERVAGLDAPAVVVVSADNDCRTMVALAAALRAGLPVLPLDPRAPRSETTGHLTVLRERFHVLDAGPRPSVVADCRATGTAPRPAGTAGYLLATGGSSGAPRLVEHAGPIVYDSATVPNAILRAAGWQSGQRQFIVGPLHHAAPFMCWWEGLLDGTTMVVQRRFDARQMIRAFDAQLVEWAQVTPTHLQWGLLALRTETASFASLRALVHTAAPCPDQVKRAWIDRLGPERVYELYGATEGIGTTLIRGDEWLDRPGSVGRGFRTQIRILDERGHTVPSGEVGEVFLRRTAARTGVGRESGAPQRRQTVDGFSSVGDHGWCDADGYLYLAPRRHDLVVVGGANVYPAEVEKALLSHPDVLDAGVFGLDDEELGRSLAALVVRRPAAQSGADDLAAHVAGLLAPHKVPWRIGFTDALPRTEAGKLRRRELADAWPASSAGGERCPRPRSSPQESTTPREVSSHDPA